MFRPVRPIRVCHLLPSLQLDDGPSNVVFSLLQNLNPADVQSSVVALYPGSLERDPSKLLDELGAEYHVLNMSRSFVDPTIIAPLWSAVRKIRPDVLQCHLVRANLYGRLVGRIAMVPKLLCVAHNVESYMTSARPADAAVRTLEFATQCMVDSYVAVSSAVAASLVRNVHITPERVSTIPNGISRLGAQKPEDTRERARAKLGLGLDEVAVGCVARLHQQKRIDLLIRAIKMIDTNVKCVIIGDGPARSDLEQLIAELGVGDRVSLVGHRGDVSSLLVGFDIFALSSAYEGLPIALLEAMRAALPCVVTNVGGMPEAIENLESGFVVPSGDVQCLSSALNMLASDRELRSALGRAAYRRFLDRYSAEKMADAYMGLYLDKKTIYDARKA